MKLASKPVRVKLESPDGDAILTFKPLQANTLLRLQVMVHDAKGNVSELEQIYKDVLSRCTNVENLSDDDGVISTERVHAMELPFDVVNAIVVGYMQSGSQQSAGAESKNDSAPAS